MTFNSLPFLVFIFLFFSIWPLAKRKTNVRFLFIIISSFVFYGWWDWRFILLILFSGLVDYFSAILIENKRRWSKFYLFLSVSVNLASLGVFKYSGFLARQLESLLQLFSIDVDIYGQLPPFTLILPVGISFYTFQSMSYTIDVYKGKLKPTRNILHFFSYLVMFPQLVAGPIVRAKDFLQQLRTKRAVNAIQFWNGMKLIILGYFQKTVLADNLGVFVDQSFAGIYENLGLYWWIVICCFSLQIYFDFCGYSQIARGLAKLMGYHFKMNFNHPYLAISLRDFWSRWHISLSTWFRDYVYIPLGGNKKGRLRSHVHMWITMLLSGLWHGAAITFVLWGAFHAAALSLERVVSGVIPQLKRDVFQPLTWASTYLQVLIGWVFFRATSLNQIGEIFQEMTIFQTNWNFIYSQTNLLIYMLLAMLFEGGHLIVRKRIRKRSLGMVMMESLVLAFMLTMIVFFRGPEKEFIYFQF
jgi:D-alanyl-lipoteichoic acid acyltransferase DltB (MBOAT superfamily)